MFRETGATNEVYTQTVTGERLMIVKDTHGHVSANGVPILHMVRSNHGVSLRGDTHTFVISEDDYARLKALPMPVSADEYI